jgi:hypothetical protein
MDKERRKKYSTVLCNFRIKYAQKALDMPIATDYSGSIFAYKELP